MFWFSSINFYKYYPHCFIKMILSTVMTWWDLPILSTVPVCIWVIWLYNFYFHINSLLFYSSYFVLTHIQDAVYWYCFLEINFSFTLIWIAYTFFKSSVSFDKFFPYSFWNVKTPIKNPLTFFSREIKRCLYGQSSNWINMEISWYTITGWWY